MSRTVKASMFALAALALSMACSAQSPTIIAQKLYDQVDQSWANHDLNKVLSFLDPSYTTIDATGKRISYAEFRKQTTDNFHDPALRIISMKTTVKDVQQPQPGRIVVYFDAETHIQHLRQQVGWEPYTITGSAESTWQKMGDQWKLVANHVLRTNTTLDPQYAASRQQQLQDRLRAIQRAGDQRACTYSYNGC